jgi:acetyl-CoA C-acetyltransferase
VVPPSKPSCWPPRPIQLGDADVVVAGGMENMSMAPYYLEKARFGYRMGPGQLQDSMIHDGLWDIVNDFHMGISNELCSERYHVSREDQDRYAAESYRRDMDLHRERPFRRRNRAGDHSPAQGRSQNLRQG